MSGISWNKIPSTGVVVITGHRGEGKSALGWWLAQEMQRKTKKQLSALGVPKEARGLLPKRGFGRGGISYVDKVEEVANLKPSVVVCDEAAFVANARRAMSETNVMWLQLIAVCRHKGHLLIFINQHNRQLDIQILADADLVIMKRPTILHLRTCRKEFEPELRQAFELFNTMRGSTKKKAYVVDYHNGNASMLPANMPKWWNEKISKAYGAVTFEGKK